MISRSPVYSVRSKLASITSYTPIWWRQRSISLSDVERRLNTRLSGYPRNHDYTVRNRRLIPGFKLHERYRLVSRLCQPGLESFLDVGSCRGFYVMSAARQPGCTRALGIDVDDGFIAISNEVREYLQLENCDFQLTGLGEVAADPGKFGGPFTTVLNIGTYHYLFWGSERCTTAFYDHREILSRFAAVCTRRLILSARLEMDRLPALIRERAQGHPGRSQYTTDQFIGAASEFFEVRHEGFLGTYPLLLLLRK